MSLIHKISLLLFLFFSTQATAQNADSVFNILSKKLKLDSSNDRSALFVTFDKTVYSANDQAWFAAYLMYSPDLVSNHTINIALINEMDETVAASQKFSMDQGLATGCFSIPDSLMSGDYFFAVYTNKNLKEKSNYIFRQPVTIIGARKDPFRISFAGTPAGENINMSAQISGINGELSGPIKLSLTVWEDGQIQKKINENANGAGQVNFIIPAASGSKNLEISGNILNGKEQMAFRRPLTWSSDDTFIRFFPQGGGLRANRSTSLAVNLKSSSGKYLSKNCVVLENKVEITAFATDVYGNGTFNLIPRAGSTYVVRIKNENSQPIQKFPAIVAQKWDVQPLSQIVADTLKLHITYPGQPEDCQLAIHNNKTLLYGALLKLRSPEALIRVPVKDWQPGMVMVKLLSKDGKIQDARMVMINTENKLNVSFSSDSASYKPLSKVTAKLNLTDKKGNPVKGIFSFSCVLEQTVTASAADIRSYDRFASSLSDKLVLPPASYLAQSSNIKHLLSRQEYMNMSDEPNSTNSWDNVDAEYDGQVVYNDKALKKPVDIMISGNQTAIFSTKENGQFTIPFEPLRGEAGKKALLTVIAKRPLGYKLLLQSGYDQFNKVLAKQHLLKNQFVKDELSIEEKNVIASSRNILLKDVVVTAKKNDTENYFGKPNTSGVCLDYVCQFDVLNCPYHVGVKSPIDGHTYNIETSTGIKKTVYHCEFRTPPDYIRILPSTVTSMQYQPFKPSEPNLPAAMNSTTLHWQAFVTTDDRGEAIITFFTNSRRGRFKLLAQGITDLEVFSAEQLIEIK